MSEFWSWMNDSVTQLLMRMLEKWSSFMNKWYTDLVTDLLKQVLIKVQRFTDSHADLRRNSYQSSRNNMSGQKASLTQTLTCRMTGKWRLSIPKLVTDFWFLLNIDPLSHEPFLFMIKWFSELNLIKLLLIHNNHTVFKSLRNNHL